MHCPYGFLFDTLMFVDLADHFQDGDKRGARITAEKGVLVGVADDDGKEMRDGFFLAEPLLGRSG